MVSSIMTMTKLEKKMYDALQLALWELVDSKSKNAKVLDEVLNALAAVDHREEVLHLPLRASARP